MLRLRVFSPSELVTEAIAAIEDCRGTRHVVRSGMTTDGHGEYISADLQPDDADRLLDRLMTIGLPPEDVLLQRVDVAGPAGGPAGDRRWDDRNDALVWAEVVDEARENQRARPSYFLYMIAAGVIATFGVIERSAILVVGAMAVSPDLMPLSAACVGIVARRFRFAARAVLTMVLGLGAAGATAFVLGLVLQATGRLASGFAVAQGLLGSLSRVSLDTACVALAAGVAGMLAFETRASAAVGVAISVTTIPAAAAAGVGFAAGDEHGALGAVLVLLTNVASLVVAGTVTLALQRRLRRRPGSAIGRP